MFAWETGLDKKRDWAILILILEVVYMRRKTGWKTGRNFYQVFMEKKQAEEFPVRNPKQENKSIN